MQIQLKQVEIVEALKAHITKQGFSLVGKTVDISFTAGRKDAGLSADISIEDAELPDLISDAEEGTAAKPALSVVKPLVNKEEAAAPVAATAEAKVDAPDTSSEKAPTSSLFG